MTMDNDYRNETSIQLPMYVASIVLWQIFHYIFIISKLMKVDTFQKLAIVRKNRHKSVSTAAIKIFRKV